MMITNFDTLYAPVRPSIGTKCSLAYISDSHPYIITDVKQNRDGKVTHVEAQLMDHKLISGSEQDGSAEYTYSINTSNPKSWFRLRKNGRWVRVGQGLNSTPILCITGVARRRMDPHF